MTTAVEVAHIVTSLMSFVGAVGLATFVITRPNFGVRLRLSIFMLVVGLATIGAFNLALVLKAEGTILAATSVLAVIGASLATIATAILAQIAFESPLVSALHHRVTAHRRTLERSRRSRAELDRRVQERTREVHEHEKRLRIALRDSQISVFMQDANLHYVWMRNAHEGFCAPEFIGKADLDVLPPAAARVATDAKMKVIETGEDVTTEIVVEPADGKGSPRYFDLTSEPYYDESGVFHGVLSVSVETTEKRMREERLKEALLEVSHRTKNQLAVLMSIARRLGATEPDIDAFLSAFEARMRALSICQDVLVERDWAAPPLRRLLWAQLEPYVSRIRRSDPALVIEGPDVKISPPAVQNLGLVLSELALNAYENGVIDSDSGQLKISWDLLDPSNDSTTNGPYLEIRWNEVGGAMPLNGNLELGFGLSMADKLARSALGGGLEFGWTKFGMSARLQIGKSVLSN